MAGVVRTWKKGLFELDFGKCLYACFCPHCAFASLRQGYDNSNWCFNCCVAPPCAIRNIVREGYSIEGTCTEDACATCWCMPCVYSQAMQEVEAVNYQHGAAIAFTQQWTQGLCGFECGGACLYACCCPNCSMASSRSTYDTSNWCFNFCCVSPPLVYNLIREGYKVDGGCCGDIFLSCCCMPCAANQLQKEVEVKGAKKPTPAVGAQPGMGQPQTTAPYPQQGGQRP